MLGLDQPSHWLVVIALAAVLFGYKRLPDASRSLGRSLRIFKTEIKGMGEDDKARSKAQGADEPAQPKALPAAEFVKKDVPTMRPRPTPSPNRRAETPAKAE